MRNIVRWYAAMGIALVSCGIYTQIQIADYHKEYTTLARNMEIAECQASTILCRSLDTIVYEKCENNRGKQYITNDTAEQIAEEIRLGEMEMLAQLLQAEAGNQGMKGEQLVADVVLNRLQDGWANSLEGVILQDKQFSSIKDGGFDRAAWRMTEQDFKASEIEYNAEKRLDESIYYFTAGNYNDSGHPAYKYGDHYFSRK